MQNLVSIIIPVFNVQSYLECCLDSVCAQEYRNLDVLLIDDGSTDSSGELCDLYAKRDSRFRVVHQKNAGAANAKNTGLDLAQGDYVTFLDSDDWCEPNWIQHLLNSAIRENADIVECNFLKEYVNGSESENVYNSLYNGEWETEEYLRMYPAAWSCAIFWNKLFRKSCLNNVRFHTDRRCVDDEFFTYRAITGANKVVRIDEQLYHYRQRQSSVTQTQNTLYQRTIDDIDILKDRYCWMKEHYPSIAMDYLRHDVNSLLYFAENFPFNDIACKHFKVSAWFYLRESLHKFPDALTIFYACRTFVYPKKKLRARSRLEDKCPRTERYYR